MKMKFKKEKIDGNKRIESEKESELERGRIIRAIMISGNSVRFSWEDRRLDSHTSTCNMIRRIAPRLSIIYRSNGSRVQGTL